MRKIFASLPLSKLVSKEISPGIECESAQTLSNYVRDRGSATIFHPVGTCKMGQDNLAVVNSDLKVHGVDGLRVVDASVMPTLIGGNTNAPTIMIAEKAASPGLLRILASADEFVGPSALLWKRATIGYAVFTFARSKELGLGLRTVTC